MSKFTPVFALALPWLASSALAQTSPPPARSAPVAATKAAAAKADLLPFKATEKTLANGLKIIIVPTGFPNIVSLQIPVQTGSRNEVEPGKSGFAHFFEHMMFRGTKAYPPEKYQDIITKSGARQNAYTSDDLTNYHTTFAKDDLETVLKVEADRFQHLDYSEDGFKTESRAVLGEYNKNSANPLTKLFEVMRDSAFQSHTYKHTTMGFIKDIEDMPNQYAYSKVFFDRWYRPERTTVIIAGDVNPQQAIALVEKYWSKWQRGTAQAPVPAEPAPHGPVYKHVPWPTQTLPWVAVSFHAPAFSTESKDQAALGMLLSLSFGPTSALHKRLVQDEQKVDQLLDYTPERVDPTLASIGARIKNIDDAVYVRDAILRTIAQLRDTPVSEKNLADAKSAQKYGLIRSLDNTEQIAATLASFVHFNRSYGTINQYYRLIDTLTPADLQAAARKYLSDAGLVVTTLSHQAMPQAIATVPTLASFAPPAKAATFDVLVQKSALPQIRYKLLFNAGSAQDPQGKEGLAALTAAMVASGGSRELKADEVSKALFPLAGSFSQQTDKEMTTFTGSIHKDNWAGFSDIALPLLLSPGFREDDFRRLKDAQKNALLLDLKDNNEEEFAKERLQTNVYAGTPYGHPVLGTLKGIEAITLDDVRQFWNTAYTQGALKVGISGDVSDAMTVALKQALAKLPEGPGLAATKVPVGKMPQGLQVEIIQKNTRATAISFGLPIDVTRAHPDFAALWLAKTWLGEHRASNAYLYQRIREIRGMNYGDYAYIEAFPRGMYQFFPSPNLGRKAQLFEVWIRPVAPENAHFALRVALTELDKLVTHGLTQEQFDLTRDYLMKNVFVMTSTQDQQLGYALDSQWYGTPEFTRMMRDGLSRLSVADVNRAIKQHLSAKNLSVVMVAKDAAGLKQQLISDVFSPIKYDGNKPQALLDEDQVIGKMKLSLSDASVTITPAGQAFAQ
ncbi:M16 family metallopeptidase [Janthinobacterium agaricidamnosum]|uniref:Insulinase family protein n=1 Tax=Janthinobacterium agaricidamnosum NBRC 102515 = DSM 9628 TaxID=1349767 RepID=W0V7R9_9BURK|nr:pitrilysin family protein [Janthinobacterium agaricidamnosum]CDG83312.1 insulinase family protein [Janthinobacterium agaricidamnosum NBRC 102515 = DSM 9628]